MPPKQNTDDQTISEAEDPKSSEPELEEKVQQLSEEESKKEIEPIGVSGQMLEEKLIPKEIPPYGERQGFGNGRCRGFGRGRRRNSCGRGMGFRHHNRMGSDMTANFRETMPEFTQERQIEFLKELMNSMKTTIDEFTRRIKALKGSESDE